MFNALSSPRRLMLVLFFLTCIPIIAALVRLVQIPMGWLPDLALHLTDTPVSHFAHALTGAAFGILGPIQFSNVLQRRFGAIHKILGRIYALAGFFLAVSALSLLVTHPLRTTALLDIVRLAVSVALIVALVLGINAARNRDLVQHKSWMIRSYAYGMGSATVVFLFLPYAIIFGDESPLISDLFMVLSWAINITIAERLISKIKVKTKAIPAMS